MTRTLWTLEDSPARPKTKQKSKRGNRKRRVISDLCPACGDERAIRWRGRGWCVVCDAIALFGGGGDDE